MKKKTLFALLSLLVLPLGLRAQNVTIGPNNGSIITGVAGGNTGDSGLGRGMGSMWRHEQLPLTFTTSDIAMLTSSGELADPSCAIDKFTVGGEERLIIGAGQTQTFMVVSLPKGYRITRYRMVMQPNISGTITLHQGKNSWDIGTNDLMRIYETEPWSLIAPYTTGNDGNSSNTHCDITDLEDGGYSFITVAHEVGNDGNLDMYNDTPENRSKEFVIERTAIHNEADDTWDMSNQLHFFFGSHGDGHDSPYQYAVSIKSFEIWFSAEGTFNAEVTPVAAGAAVSALESPFSTSKMDVGSITWDNSRQLYVYDYSKVQSLIAYNWLYQKDAIQGGKPADVADEKHIYPLVVDNEGVIAFGNDTYFIEPPTTIKTASGWNSPIGFRIVGAKFDCKWGTQTEGSTISITNGYRISILNGGNTRYLNTSLDFVQVNQNQAQIWQVDNWGNLYFETTVGTGSNATTFKRYLACFGEGDTRMLSLSTSATGTEATWNVKIVQEGNINRLAYESDSHNFYYLHYIYKQEGGAYHYRGYCTKNQNSDLATATALNQTHTVNIPAYHPGNFTLEVYDKTGTSVVKTLSVTQDNANSDDTSYKLEGLNNDAVKFRVSNLAEGKQAIVKVTLQLEALNPYIDKMDIVCHDDAGNLELTQSFTSNDFSVSGGKFIFYVPEDYSDVPLTFTFSDLYSKYGDNTYYEDEPTLRMNGNSRYSFVTSDYFKEFSGNQVSDIEGFPVNDGLYDEDYSPDSPAYTSKVFTSTAGNIRFKFNNAEDLGGGTGSLLEYPFSVTDYLSDYDDPDAAAGTTPEKGAFIPCVLIANPSVKPNGVEYKKSDIYYVFTADETRYNIAPTTEMQHRYYAFYRMDIELEARTFTPDFTWVKIYDSTAYAENGAEKDDSMWGLILDVAANGNNEVEGYLTYQEIIDNIIGREASGNLPAIPSKLDPSNTNAPASVKQILYVDGTNLYAMLNSSQNSVIKTLQDLKALLNPNSLVFLPVNTTSTLDNVAYETIGGSFVAGRNIVLTDKVPFYTPYDIYVDAANYATYERLITVPKNGKVTNATVMLPFTLTLDGNGVHTNPSGTSFPGDGLRFTVNLLGSSDIFKPEDSDDYGIAFFEPFTGSATEANKPYMIMVTDDPGGTEVSFIATQKGSLIVKTPDGTTAGNHTGEIIAGQTTEGVSFGNETVNFVNNASYSGLRFDHNSTSNNDIFYFANNQYFNMNDLAKGRPYLYVYPFRGVYAYSAATPGSGSRQFSLKRFDISYDKPGSELGESTGINDWNSQADLMIRTGKGFMTMTAAKAQKVTIYSVNGAIVAKTNLQDGDTQTVNLPTGLYVVNNVKIAVK